jgi:hypothetical protein
MYSNNFYKSTKIRNKKRIKHLTKRNKKRSVNKRTRRSPRHYCLENGRMDLGCLAGAKTKTN